MTIWSPSNDPTFSSGERTDEALAGRACERGRTRRFAPTTARTTKQVSIRVGSERSSLTRNRLRGSMGRHICTAHSSRNAATIRSLDSAGCIPSGAGAAPPCELPAAPATLSSRLEALHALAKLESKTAASELPRS